MGPFSHVRYHFMSGMPAGETARIRDDDGHVLLHYRGFASAIGVVAALALSVLFSLVIAMLVPPLSVTLFNDSAPMLTISQISRMSVPSVLHAVVTPDGRTLALIRRGFLSRLGRNRWVVQRPGDRVTIADAIEESLGRAFVRKLLGKFNRRYEANMLIRRHGRTIGVIFRRPAAGGSIDTLDLSRDREEVLDRRIAVALA
ncbi:MAG TPA: hypothetical protein VNL91_05250, partial [Thermoanaerobaculia bacterium]|nr:hypothetical protein [Thermoanaerobaculia bacterium]